MGDTFIHSLCLKGSFFLVTRVTGPALLNVLGLLEEVGGPQENPSNNNI